MSRVESFIMILYRILGYMSKVKRKKTQNKFRIRNKMLDYSFQILYNQGMEEIL